MLINPSSLLDNRGLKEGEEENAKDSKDKPKDGKSRHSKIKSRIRFWVSSDPDNDFFLMEKENIK